MAPSLRALTQLQVTTLIVVVMVTSFYSTVVGAKSDNNTELQEKVEVLLHISKLNITLCVFSSVEAVMEQRHRS